MKRTAAIATLGLMALALVAWRQHAGEAARAQTRWEYKRERLSLLEIEGGKDGPQNFVSNLNRLGEDGWELAAMQGVLWAVSVSGANDNKGVEEQAFDCYFKRPK